MAIRLKSLSLLNALSMRHRSLYRRLLKTERLLPVAAVRDHRLGSLGIQFLAQFGAVVGLVTEHALGVLHSADKALRDRAIVRLTASQEDGEETPFSICKCVYLRVTFFTENMLHLWTCREPKTNSSSVEILNAR